jgi:hypothetical protein
MLDDEDEFLSKDGKKSKRRTAQLDGKQLHLSSLNYR